MKKTVAFFSLLITCVAMFAQSGPTFPYQAVVRNSQNQLIKDSTFAIGVEVYQGVDLKFSETQNVTTNANGQFTMNIGGGTVVSGAMNDVTDWSVAKFKITYHLSEGDIVSENAVRPVPYALQAANVAESAGLDCADVKTCIADTLTHYTTTTALEQMLQQISVRMDAQEATIDSLRHLVDSLSNLPHGGGPAAFTCGTSKVKDVENNEYSTVRIGNQCWMAQNLRTKTHQYGNVWTKSDADSAIYGRYYDWAAVMQGESGSTVQGICPAGWHVPSDADWDTLTTYVSSVEAYKCNSSIASALSDSTGWKSSSICCAGDNSSATINITGFAAVPAGSFTDGFGGFGYDAYFWSATEYNNQMALCQSLHSLATGVSSYEDYKSHCYSVRCLRDAGIVGNAGSNESGIGSGNTPSTPATMSCEDVIECMGDTLGRLNARITSQGETIAAQGETIAAQGNTIAAQGTEIETLNGTVTSQGETINAQGNTIDSLAHIVDSLSNLTPVTPDTPTGAFNCGTDSVKDVDNIYYHTVAIGNQCWMKEDLRTNTLQYGHTWVASNICLYDWEAAMQGASSTNYPTLGNKVQGICPAGWHVPSDAEWDALTHYVSSQSEYQCGSESTNIAKALSSKTGWNANSNSCTVGNTPEDNNATGFTAVPAGGYYGESLGFSNVGNGAYMWSSTQKSDGKAWYRLLGYGKSSVVRSEGNKGNGYSVRCLRNADAGGNTPSTPATMSCEDVMNCLGDTLGRLNARFTSQSAEIETLNGTVETLNTTVTTQGETIEAQGNTIDSLSHIVDSLSNLPRGASFTCGTDSVKDIDNNWYHTVPFGGQCWMKENLRTTKYADNTSLLMGSSLSTDTAYWYYPNNDASNKSTYGLLYNWKAVMNGASSTDNNPSGVQGICPNGWHVPSDAEWTQLTRFVKSQPAYVCAGCSGSDNDWYTYCIAKALASTTGWVSDSETCVVGDTTRSNNATGFSAMPAGFYDGDYNLFSTYTCFWSTTEDFNSYSYGRAILTYYNYVDRQFYNEANGFSVRCVRN